MYFPQLNPNHIVEQLIQLESLPYYEQLRKVSKLYSYTRNPQIRNLLSQIESKIIVEQLIQLETLPYYEQLDKVLELYSYTRNPQITNLLSQIESKINANIIREREKEKLESKNHELRYEIEDCKHRLSSYEKEIQELHHQLSIGKLMVSSSPKGYKNLFIFLFAHPNNHSNATKEILNRMNYLDKMTRDVHFTMPGYEWAKAREDIVNDQDKNMKLTFDENLFLSHVQELEDKSNGKFSYQDDCELVFVGQKDDGKYDIDTLIRIDLDYISKDKGIDPIKLIIAVSQAFRKEESQKLDAQTLVTHIIGELCVDKPKSILRVFIAGAKKLKLERLLLREQLSKLSNQYNLDIRTITFEDFQTSLTGKKKGRQEDYNKFIKEKANIVIFVFSSVAGRITEEEFEVAYNSYQANNRPQIFVYVKKQLFMFDKRLRNIKKRFFSDNQEYYVEYNNVDNLCYLFYNNISKLLQKEVAK